ncbi:hypothetical protein RIVM261_058700 [Rivularia sp. IAM M-261]|nr:hypothetical protein CAL7716_033730 [Calothrix sp. PCC 7716]GJD20914.1 hypothetical protein RIVM261_058700 [Rivularia sp. IAM M-261]
MTQHSVYTARKLPLRLILVVPFIVQIFAVVGLVGYLSFKNGQKAGISTSASINPVEIVVPQESELQRLLEYAQDGLLKRIIETAEQIQRRDSRYQPFAQHLLLLAEQFQIEKIEAFLQQLIK